MILSRGRVRQSRSRRGRLALRDGVQRFFFSSSAAALPGSRGSPERLPRLPAVFVQRGRAPPSPVKAAGSAARLLLFLRVLCELTPWSAVA